MQTDIDWTMAAAGVLGDLLQLAAEGGPALALVSDALWARTTSEKTAGLEAADADVTRFRLGLEESWPIPLDGGDSGASLVPKLTLGARHDGATPRPASGWSSAAGLPGHVLCGAACDRGGARCVSPRRAVRPGPVPGVRAAMDEPARPPRVV